jgi:hypothetical protein
MFIFLLCQLLRFSALVVVGRCCWRLRAGSLVAGSLHGQRLLLSLRWDLKRCKRSRGCDSRHRLWGMWRLRQWQCRWLRLCCNNRQRRDRRCTRHSHSHRHTGASVPPPCCCCGDHDGADHKHLGLRRHTRCAGRLLRRCGWFLCSISHMLLSRVPNDLSDSCITLMLLFFFRYLLAQWRGRRATFSSATKK